MRTNCFSYQAPGASAGTVRTGLAHISCAIVVALLLASPSIASADDTLYSADYENAAEPQAPLNLLVGPISSDTRLYLYYKPASHRRFIYIRLTNHSSHDETVDAIGALASDPSGGADVSFLVAKRDGCFWLRSLRDQDAGVTKQLTVPSGASRDVAVVPLSSPGAYVSAIIRLRPRGQFETGEVIAAVITSSTALPTSDDGHEYQRAPLDGRNPGGAVAANKPPLRVTYELGFAPSVDPQGTAAPAGTLVVGTDQVNGSGRDWGDFGVKYSYTVNLSNKTASTQHADVYVEFRGGGGQVTIYESTPGKTVLYQSNNLVGGSRYRLADLGLDVPPNTSPATLTLDLLSEGNSAAPIWIEVGQSYTSRNPGARHAHGNEHIDFNGDIASVETRMAQECLSTDIQPSQKAN